MTFGPLETSREDGQPIELYDFRFGAQSALWTTNPVAVTFDSLTYQPVAVRRERLGIRPDERADVLTITVPASTPLVRAYINSVPGQVATLTIRRVHRTDTGEQVIQLFKGIVQAVSFTLNGTSADIAVLPIAGELGNTIPRAVFSRACNHVLYDAKCGVSSTSFRHVGNVSGAAADVLSISGLAARGSGWATAGFIANAAGDFRLIIEHTGDDIRLLVPFPTSPLGQSVEVFAGCDHSAETCGSKFDNVLRFGGFPFVPLQNIFVNGINTA